MANRRTSRPMEILFVEDSLLDAKIAIGALKHGNVRHRMTLIHDGAEALQFLHREGIFARAPRPDLILLDLRLPKVDGLEVLDEIKSDYELKDIPIVIMTGSEYENDRIKCELLHVDAYVTKPIDLPKFLSLVKQLRRFWHDEVILPALE